MAPGEVAVTNEQLLQTFRPPTLVTPYPVTFNPHYSSAVFIEKTRQWLQDHNVDKVVSPKQYRMVTEMDIAGLAARVYPEAPESGLEWVNRFLVLQWVLDEMVDSSETGQSPETALSLFLEMQLIMLWSFPDDPVLRTRVEPFLNHLEHQAREEKIRYVESVVAEARTKRGTLYPKPMVNVTSKLYLDVWTDVVTSASPGFSPRLAQANQHWLLGVLKETEYRKFKTIPSSIDEYVQMRRRTAGLLHCVVAVDFIYGTSTPDTWIYSPEMQRVIDPLIDIVGWENDIYSFRKEVLEGWKFNMVVLISTFQNASYTEAADITIRMIYDRIADFELAAKEWESTTPSKYKHCFDLYLSSCQNWVAGGHDWTINCVRYQ